MVPFGLAKQEDKVTHQATRSLGVLICSTANCFGSFGKNCRASTINVVNGSQENRARAKRTDTLESWRRVVLTIYTKCIFTGAYLSGKAQNLLKPRNSADQISGILAFSIPLTPTLEPSKSLQVHSYIIHVHVGRCFHMLYLYMM